MEYVVELTLRAQRDLEHLYEDIDALNSEAARRWYLGLYEQILTLETLPYRYAVTRENKKLRHLLYGHGHNTYRVIYRIIGARVKVLHIRHGARKGFK
jgi:plasmid stabilization system protein ParE